jgi:hypothetical protein
MESKYNSMRKKCKEHHAMSDMDDTCREPRLLPCPSAVHHIP